MKHCIILNSANRIYYFCWQLVFESLRGLIMIMTVNCSKLLWRCSIFWWTSFRISAWKMGRVLQGDPDLHQRAPTARSWVRKRSACFVTLCVKHTALILVLLWPAHSLSFLTVTLHYVPPLTSSSFSSIPRPPTAPRGFMEHTWASKNAQRLRRRWEEELFLI